MFIGNLPLYPYPYPSPFTPTPTPKQVTRAEDEALLGTHFTLSKRVHQFGREKLGTDRKRFS